MEKRGEKRTQGNTETINLSESLGVSLVYGLINSYRDVAKVGEKVDKEAHYKAMQTVLESAVSAYSGQVESIKSRSYVSEYRLSEINKSFDRVVEGARSINFPKEELAKMSHRFIAKSLDYNAPFSPIQREAVAKLGLAIGGSDLKPAKVRQLTDHHVSALSEVLSSKQNPIQMQRAQQAHRMIEELDFIVKYDRVPSVTESLSALAKENGRTIATAGAAGAVALSILAPLAVAGANASPDGNNITPVVSIKNGNHPTSIEAAPNVVQPPSAVTINIALPDKKEDKPTSISISNSAPEAAKTTVSVVVPTISKDNNVKEPSSISVGVNPEAAAVVAPVISMPQNVDTASKPTSISVESTAPAPAVAVTPSVDLATQVEIGRPMSIEAAPVPQAPAPNIESSNLTPDQKKAQVIIDQINGNGDMTVASSLIRANFRDQSQPAADYKNGFSDNATNKGLNDQVSKLQIALENTIHAGGHKTDASYVNTSLLTLSILDAASNDQSVLKSPAVQNMLGAAKRPDDVYKGKLFDQYVAQAKKTLEANDSALLKGFDSEHIPSVETMYAYSLMASTSDDEQAKQIQAIKDAETAAAAAKAAAEAAAHAAHSNPNQILQKAIEQAAAQFGWSDGQKAILLAAAQQGASPAAVSGLGGNVFAESGFDPGKQEYGSGIGFGFIQESYGRRTAMEQAAAAAGVNVADPNWQANYVIGESKGREQRDNSNNEWGGFVGINDPVAAADYWLYNNERAGVPHSQTREAKASEIFNQINGQIQAIQAAEAAAAKAAAEAKALADAKAKAEAEAKAKAEAAANHMQNGPDIYHSLRQNEKNGDLSPDALAPVTSGNVEYAPGDNNLNSDYYNQIRNGEGASLKLNPEAARQFNKLADAFAAQFHKKLAVGAAYRSFAGQENQKTYWTQQGQPDNAATPGHSFHGWGLAVDLELSGSDEHAWLVQNGPTFGWVWPNKSGEDWHFEYMGAAAQGNGSDSPEPGL